MDLNEGEDSSLFGIPEQQDFEIKEELPESVDLDIDSRGNELSNQPQTIEPGNKGTSYSLNPQPL